MWGSLYEDIFYGKLSNVAIDSGARQVEHKHMSMRLGSLVGR